MHDNKLWWNHMVDGYVYMAVFTLRISRQAIYVYVRLKI